MKRDLSSMSKRHFDVVVIGGGIYGASVAWDAALRGLSVALVDKGDFGGATSANSQKIIHGGLRYLQHGDLRRMRESARERRILMRIAPNFVHPLPFLLPTYGYGMRSKMVMAAAMIINDLMSFDRNKGCDPDKRIPRGRIISREECLRLVPGLDDQGLTGGALWFDGQVLHPERLVLAFLLSAVTKGAEIANYAKVIGFLEEDNRIRGVRICDEFTKKVFEISSKIVVNTSGPWINQVLQLLNRKPSENWHFCRALVLVTKQLSAKIAFGVFSKRPYRDKDDLLKKGSRILFITPWQDSSLVGTLHGDEDSSPERGDVSEEEVNGFLNEVNEAYYGAGLKRDDVYQVYHGLLPIVGKNAITGDAQIAKRCVIEDHAKEDGLEGLISVVGVKFTTARDAAEKTVNLALEKIGHQPVGCKTAETFLVGSKIEGFGDFLSKAVRNKPQELDVETVTHLVYQYGQAYREILDDLEKDPSARRANMPRTSGIEGTNRSCRSERNGSHFI